MAIVMLSPDHFENIRTRNMHDLDLNLFNVPWSNANMTMERPYTTAYLLVIAMLDLSITARYLQWTYACL